MLKGGFWPSSPSTVPEPARRSCSPAESLLFSSGIPPTVDTTKTWLRRQLAEFMTIPFSPEKDLKLRHPLGRVKWLVYWSCACPYRDPPWSCMEHAPACLRGCSPGLLRYLQASVLGPCQGVSASCNGTLEGDVFVSIQHQDALVHNTNGY